MSTLAVTFLPKPPRTELMLPPYYVSPPHQAVNSQIIFDSSVDRRMSGLTFAARLNNVTLLLTIGLSWLVVFFG